jgi:hypothetical protein
MTNMPPQVTLTNLAASIMALAGGTIRIDYSDNDPDSDATTTFLADLDGDLMTTGDQITIAADLPEMDGAAQSVLWDTTGVAHGTYRIFAVTEDEDSVATDEAPGTVMVNDVASFSRALRRERLPDERRDVEEPRPVHVVARGRPRTAARACGVPDPSVRRRRKDQRSKRSRRAA